MGHSEPSEETDAAYGRRVGERLRSIRRQKRLSLQDVEANSNQEFKASVLGAYERGERAISVARLERLARYYSVPVDQLLPRSSSSGVISETLDLTERTGRSNGVTIHLGRLDGVPRPEGEMLGRYLVMIQVQRQDFNGRMLTIRQDDLRAVACILGVEIDEAIDRLDDLGLIHTNVTG
ncbi:MAG: transcriptional regulator [Acidimicrobiia bacterium]|nr:transcriptional regulator [Acidimicrobiia bacterium]